MVFIGFENDPGGFLVMHLFKTPKERAAWLWETEGITLASPGGREAATSLKQVEKFQGPVIHH